MRLEKSRRPPLDVVVPQSARRDQPSQRRRGRARGHVSRQTQRLDRSFEIAAESRQTRGVVVFAMMIGRHGRYERSETSPPSTRLSRARFERDREPRRDADEPASTAREENARRSREDSRRAMTRMGWVIRTSIGGESLVTSHDSSKMGKIACAREFISFYSLEIHSGARRESTADWDDDARARDARDDDEVVPHPVSYTHLTLPTAPYV